MQLCNLQDKKELLGNLCFVTESFMRKEKFLSTEQGLEIKLPPWVILVLLIKLDQVAHSITESLRLEKASDIKSNLYQVSSGRRKVSSPGLKGKSVPCTKYQ